MKSLIKLSYDSWLNVIMKWVNGYGVKNLLRKKLLFLTFGLMFFVPFHMVIFNLPSYTMIVCNFEVSTILLSQRTH